MDRQKKVVILGHSFARRLYGKIGNPIPSIRVPDNLGCTREKVYWCLRREVEGEEKESVREENFNLIDECLGEWETIYKMFGRCDLLIIMLGSNDIASKPQSLPYHLSQLVLFTDTMLGCMARRIAIVETLPRIGPNGFPERHCPDFQALPGIQTWKETTQLYKTKVKCWNTMVQAAFKGHPDIHWIDIKGLRGPNRICQDGIHYDDVSNVQFAKHMKRAIVNLLSEKRHVPGIDDPVEQEQEYDVEDDSHLGAVGGCDY